MQTRPIQMSDVMYNAAEQCFEALVTVHDGPVTRKYACSINAPISMSFADAAKGLSKQAERRHMSRGGLHSEIAKRNAMQRAGRSRFNIKAWLSNVIELPGSRAA